MGNQEWSSSEIEHLKQSAKSGLTLTEMEAVHKRSERELILALMKIRRENRQSSLAQTQSIAA